MSHTIINSLLLLFLLVQVTQSNKNYQFDVIYECEENQFQQIQLKHSKQTSYVCKHWIQRILIRQQKNHYIRYESSFRQKEEQIEEEEEKEFQEQQEREKELEEMEREKRKEQREERLKQLEREKQFKRLNQAKGPNIQQYAQMVSTTNGQNPQSIQEHQEGLQQDSDDDDDDWDQQNYDWDQQDDDSQDSDEKEQMQEQNVKQEKNLSVNDQIQNKQKRQLMSQNTQAIKTLYPQQNLTRSQPSYDHLLTSSIKQRLKSHYFFDTGKYIEHNIVLRKHKEQQEKEQKFKPLKSHRSHPVDDIFFILELIQMNSIILERSSEVTGKVHKPKKNLRPHPDEEGKFIIEKEGQTQQQKTKQDEKEKQWENQTSED